MIPQVVVVDASVVVEYLVELKLTREAKHLFNSLRETDGIEFWAPDLLYPEAVSALRKLVGLGAIPAGAGTRAVDRLVRLPIAAAGTAALMVEAWKLRHALTPYDACYVALARRLGARFVTADQRLVRGLSTPDVIFLGDFEF
jgi:predicted nucleic acid-binding protein